MKGTRSRRRKTRTAWPKRTRHSRTIAGKRIRAFRTSKPRLIPKGQAGLSILALIASVAVAGSCDPSISIKAPDPVQLRFQGLVTGANGLPLAGASVSLEQLTFVWQFPVATARTGADGRYTLDAESSCKHGTDLYTSPGNASILVSSAGGYDNLSSVNISRNLYCVTESQTVDFAMRQAQAP